MDKNVVENKIIESVLRLDEILKQSSWENLPLKNTQSFISMKTWGNDLYTRSDHDAVMHYRILNTYSMSIAFSPNFSEELGISYGNRSAFLLHIKRYRESLSDINKALDLPIKDSTRLKYLSRRVQCMAALRAHETEFSIQEVRSFVKNRNFDKSTVLKTERILLKAANLLKIQLKEQQVKVKKEKVSLIAAEQIPCASEAVEIAYDSKYGQHLIASRDIKPGEILYAAKPFAITPKYGNFYTHCSHCYKFSFNTIPCNNCPYSVYCSEECKNRAKMTYHDVECNLISMIWSGSKEKNNVQYKDLRLLTIRSIIRGIKEAGSIQALLEMIQDIDSCSAQKMKTFSHKGDIYGENFRILYSMKKKDLKDDLKQEMFDDAAATMYIFLLKTTFFDNSLKKAVLDDEKILIENRDAMFIGELFCHLYNIIATIGREISNVHISEMDGLPDPDKEGSACMYVSPFMSMLNHICDPNVDKLFSCDGEMVLYSTQTIETGKQLFHICKDPYFSVPKELRDRNRDCEDHFLSDCLPCQGNWPTADKLRDKVIFRKKTSPVDIEKTNYLQEMAWQIFYRARYDDYKFDKTSLELTAQAIDCTMRHTVLPHDMYAKLNAALQLIMEHLYGLLVEMPSDC